MSETIGAYEQLTATARLALGRGDRQGAQAALSAAIRTPEDMDRLGLGNPDAIIRLGILNQDAGLHAEAERLFAEALLVGERVLGIDDPGLVTALTKLGTALIARGAHDEAEPLLMRALMISEMELGADHPDLIVLLNDLSRLYLKQGAYSRAEPLLHRLLAFKRSKGDDHPEVATVLASLAVVRQALGDHDASEQLYRRVLQIRERTLAPNHFGVAAALEHLGEACAARGKVGEALALFHRALSMREQTLGVGHASLRISRERIADLQLQASEESSYAPPDVRDAPTPPARQMQHLPPAVPRVATPSPAVPVVGPTEAPQTAKSAEPPRVASPVESPRAASPVESPRVASAVESNRAASPVESPRAASAVESPRVAAPVALPAEGVPSSLRTTPSAVREMAAPLMVPPRQSEAEERTEEFASDGRQEAIVIPSADGFLDFRDVLKEMEANEAEENQPRDILATLKQVLPQRRVQAAVIGAAVIALLVAAIALRPHGTTNGGSLNASEVVSRLDPMGVSALPAGNVESPLTRTSNGALEPRSAADPVASRTGGTRAAEKASSSNENTSPGSLELANVARAPIANVATTRSDSIVRAATSLPVDDASPIQLLANGAEKRLATPDFSETKKTSTAAKLRGALPRPIYPAYLRQVGVQGEVVVQFLVDAKGFPDASSLKVIRTPHDLLTTEARRVVTRLRFDPARTDGPDSKAVTEWVQISFVFDPSSR